MNANILLKHYDRISEAPDAIPRLRRFILDLAVRGKLVEQDSRDEPASKLLKRIQAEKARRIKAGELRSPRVLDWADEIEELFSLPKSWTWIRLADIGAIIGGGTPPSGDYDNFTNGGAGVAWLTPADLGKHDGLYVSHGARDLTEKGLQSSSATLMPKDSVLFTSRAPIGYTAIAANEITTNQGFKSVVPYIVECSRYIAAYLQAFGPWIDSKASGTTFREVSGKIVSGLPFPLPPLAEQQRIVAKVDELMALCDQLEAARNEREARRQRLTAASLQRLNQPADAASLRADARFHLDNLTRLTTRPEQIKQLRQTILNLAVRGCLVVQDPQDERINVLLESIKLDQRNAIKIGSLKKNDLSKNQEIGELITCIPASWSLEKLASLITFGPQNGVSPKETKDETAPKALTLTATTSGYFNSSYCKHIELLEKDCKNYWLSAGDVLFQRGNTREYVGMAAIFDGPERSYVFPDLMIRVRFSKNVDLRFAHIVLISPPLRHYFSDNASGASTTMPKINQTTLLNAPFPLPPLAEQHRIVAKVDELMALCDQLEAQLTTTATDSRRLLEAVLRDALHPIEVQ